MIIPKKLSVNIDHFEKHLVDDRCIIPKHVVKGRPKNPNKNIRFSCTLTPAQLEWLNKTADEMGIERSAVLRNCVDKMMLSNLAKSDEK